MRREKGHYTSSHRLAIRLLPTITVPSFFFSSHLIVLVQVARVEEFGGREFGGRLVSEGKLAAEKVVLLAFEAGAIKTFQVVAIEGSPAVPSRRLPSKPCAIKAVCH